MWCCCGQKRDNSKQLEVQVKALVEKCALVASKQRNIEEENTLLRNMQWYLDDCYYALDCEVEHLHNEVQVVFRHPGGHHEQRGRMPRQMWSELQGSTNTVNNTTDY